MNQSSSHPLRIGIIGGGISGLAAANVLQQCGHTVVIYEKSNHLGGVWAKAYPKVRLQNIASQYRLAGSPWFPGVDENPTAEQITRYLQQTVAEKKLNLLTGHEVVEMQESVNQRWVLTIRHQGEVTTELFDKVVVAVGQYTQPKARPDFLGEDLFQGEIITERDITDFADFASKRVAVVGFGKSALDAATLAAEHGAQVAHIFRQPRWMIPRYIFGLHYTALLFSRQSSVFMTSWAHPTARARLLHSSLSFMVRGFWAFLRFLVTRLALRHGRGHDAKAKARLKSILPDHSLLSDLRSAVALAPDDYLRYVVEGKIEPYHAELGEFTADGVLLQDSRQIDADVTILSLGSSSPVFPFLPDHYRELLESEPDGVQLYRHLIHPRIPNLAFAGFNHGFMHIPAAEVGMMWVDAYFCGRILLPTTQDMEASIETIRDWKREHINFEPSRSCAVNTRYQQYLDIMLKELTLSPYRKMPNIFAEVFARYTADDYDNVLAEYLALPHTTKFLTLDLDT